MLYFKRKIASHWKLLLLIIGICAVSLYCIIDLVIWSDGYAVENLCCLDIFSFAGFRGFTAVVLSIVGLFLAYRVLHGDFSYDILLRFHNKSTLYARQGLCLLILSFLLAVVCMAIVGLLSFRYAPQSFYNWNSPWYIWAASMQTRYYELHLVWISCLIWLLASLLLIPIGTVIFARKDIYLKGERTNAR